VPSAALGRPCRMVESTTRPATSRDGFAPCSLRRTSAPVGEVTIKQRLTARPRPRLHPHLRAVADARGRRARALRGAGAGRGALRSRAWSTPGSDRPARGSEDAHGIQRRLEALAIPSTSRAHLPGRDVCRVQAGQTRPPVARRLANVLPRFPSLSVRGPLPTMARMDDLLRLAALLTLPLLAWALGRLCADRGSRPTHVAEDDSFDGIPSTRTEPSSCPPAAAGSPSTSPPPPR
jgi:hypothetical protein